MAVLVSWVSVVVVSLSIRGRTWIPGSDASMGCTSAVIWPRMAEREGLVASNTRVASHAGAAQARLRSDADKRNVDKERTTIS